MYINIDASGLEVNAVAYLSQDSVLMKEIIEKQDIHSNNQERFNLPKGELGRLIAKVFKFRLIYGGSAYSYANDPDFRSISSSEKYWQKVIDEYYDKYRGIRDWHSQIIREVIETGILTIPTGRQYSFHPKEDYRGEKKWPETNIKNYPVQGLGADIMSVVRVDFAHKVWNSNLEHKLRSTVHDSLVIDSPTKNVDKIIEIAYNSFDNAPNTFENIFGVKYNLPLFCEIKIGKDLKNLQKVKRG